MSKTQNYAFTVFPQEGDLAKFMALECEHILLAEETCPTSGKVHWQSCIRWEFQRTWKASRGDLPWSNYEACRDKYETNVAYCLKGEQSKEEWNRRGGGIAGPNYGKNLKIVYEGGKRPMTQKRKGECGEEYARRNIKLCMEGRKKDMDPKALLRIKDYTAAANALRDPPADLPSGGRGTYHEWHWSTIPGTGKSYYCRNGQHSKPFVHEGGVWWDDYNHELVVYIEDISENGVKLMDKLKQALDEYAFRAPVKGSTIYIRPLKVIISSNCHPMDIWNNVHGRALMDRLKIYNWDACGKYLLPDGTPNPAWAPPEGLAETWYDKSCEAPGPTDYEDLENYA